LPEIGRKKAVVIAGYAISATCLAVLAHGVDWPAFVVYLRTARAILIAPAAVLVVATYGMFALRWRLLLSFRPPLSLVQAASFLMVGYLGNLLLPMRAGDATRILLIRSAYGHGAARALSSILLERLLDVLVIVAFGVGVGLVASLPRDVVMVLRVSAALAFLAALLIVWVGVLPSSSISLLKRVMHRFDPPTVHAVIRQIETFSDALTIVFPRDRRSVVRMALVVALTTAGWASFGAAMILCTAAVDVHPAIASGLLLMVITNLGSAIPSSPGSIGVYHALAVVALSPWNIGIDLAMAVATISHALVIALQLLLGLAATAILRTRRRLRVVRMANQDPALTLRTPDASES
jgi:glycosyltransferase 2 family protein